MHKVMFATANVLTYILWKIKSATLLDTLYYWGTSEIYTFILHTAAGLS